jgi:hypothetical protein
MNSVHHAAPIPDPHSDVNRWENEGGSTGRPDSCCKAMDPRHRRTFGPDLNVGSIDLAKGTPGWS